ncbi:MAG: 50S ribosomal protein L19 [Patescibacteria group bacterium]
MKAALQGVAISPVNMEERKTLGIRPGDTVRVHQKIQEKGKTRIQLFEGLVLARKHGGEPGATFTVRKVTSGVGVEKIFPLYSPLIDKIEIVKRAKVRRAKLYHIREKVNREIKRQMRRMSFVSLATESGAEVAAREAEEAKRAEEEAAAAETAATEAAATAETETAAESTPAEGEAAPATETTSETTPETDTETSEAAVEETTESTTETPAETDAAEADTTAEAASDADTTEAVDEEKKA